MKTCNSIATCREKKVAIFRKNGYVIRECEVCGHQYAEIPDSDSHVARVYSDQYFFGGQAGYPDYLQDRDLLIRTGIRYGKLLSKYAAPGELLDVGCAAGFVLKGLIQSGWVGHGIEPNERMARYGREELKLDVQTGDFESLSAMKQYDLITLIQVIGHFYDLDKALQNVRKLLRKDGMVLVESWRRESSIARLMKSSWHEYNPPSVIHWFSDNTLLDLFRYYGFAPVANGYPSKRISMNHALSILFDNSPSGAVGDGMIARLRRSIGNWNVRYPPVDLKWYLFKK